MENQESVDARNRAFWDELCGTSLARQLGISDRTESSLRRFDDAYLAFYPYLLRRVPVAKFGGKKVLEIGLGYGTLGQQIAAFCGEYSGLDIAKGPVDMMNHRLALRGMGGKAVQGSMLECAFYDSTFDVVVSIGCFHHTGDLQRCIDETYRVLKPGGEAYIMVYNKFSYRNWMRWPVATLKALLQPESGRSRSQSERKAYDASQTGEAAPETVFTSTAELQHYFKHFSAFSAAKENWGGLLRLTLLPVIGPVCGLDIYVAARK